MRQQLKDMLEHLDAEVFTGDAFHDRTNRIQLSNYISSWVGELISLEKSEDEGGEAPVQGMSQVNDREVLAFITRLGLDLEALRTRDTKLVKWLKEDPNERCTRFDILSKLEELRHG